MDPIQQMQERVGKGLEAIREAYAPIAASFAAFREQQEALSEDIRRAFEKYPQQMRTVREYLFARGWYLGPNMTLPGTSYLADLVDGGEDAKVEEWMQEWAESRIDSILVDLKEKSPNRHGIIADAIGAHRNGKYSLSVPVLFAQADGLANDGFGTFLFRGKPVHAFEKLFDTLGPLVMNGILETLVSPLLAYSTLGQKPLVPLPNSKTGHANRHEVLHGIDTNYASKANSLRALMLVDYLLGITDMIDRHKDWVEELRKEYGDVVSAAAESCRAKGRNRTNEEAHQ